VGGGTIDIVRVTVIVYDCEPLSMCEYDEVRDTWSYVRVSG
jgi:hypothetical protein